MSFDETLEVIRHDIYENRRYKAMRTAALSDTSIQYHTAEWLGLDAQSSVWKDIVIQFQLASDLRSVGHHQNIEIEKLVTRTKPHVMIWVLSRWLCFVMQQTPRIIELSPNDTLARREIARIFQNTTLQLVFALQRPYISALDATEEEQQELQQCYDWLSNHAKDLDPVGQSRPIDLALLWTIRTIIAFADCEPQATVDSYVPRCLHFFQHHVRDPRHQSAHLLSHPANLPDVARPFYAIWANVVEIAMMDGWEGLQEDQFRDRAYKNLSTWNMGTF